MDAVPTLSNPLLRVGTETPHHSAQADVTTVPFLAQR